VTSIFGIDIYIETDAQNIISSLLKISKFIKQHPLDNKTEMNILSITSFGSATWNLIQSIYKSEWDHITMNNKKCLFQQYVLNQFNNGPHFSSSCSLTDKPTEISITPPLISLRPSKETLAKSKFFKKDNIAKKIVFLSIKI